MEWTGPRRRVLVIVLGLATVGGIAALQVVDDAPSRAPVERSTTSTTKGA